MKTLFEPEITPGNGQPRDTPIHSPIDLRQLSAAAEGA